MQEEKQKRKGEEKKGARNGKGNEIRQEERDVSCWEVKAVKLKI